MDLSQTVNILKTVPDQALQRELTTPSGLVPNYLVLAEAQRRQLMRQQAEQQQQQPSGSVYDDVIRNMMARQPPPGLPPAPAGMAPTPSAPPSGAMGSTPPQNFQIPRMADGGSVDDIDDGSDDTAVMSPTGSASRMAPAVTGIPAEWEPIIQRAARAHSLDPDVLRAMIRQESGGNRRAISPKGALGPMQLMEGTAREMGVTDRTDPEQSINAGAGYLRKQLDKYGGKLPMALAAFNAGPGAVDYYGGIPPYPETRNYIKNIQQNLGTIKGFTGGGRPDLLPSGPITTLDEAAPTAIPQDLTQATQLAPAIAQQPALPAAPALPPPDFSGLAAVLSAPGAAPAAPAVPAAAVAPGAAPVDWLADMRTPENARKMRAYAEELIGKSPDDPALRAEVARLQQQAEKMMKPDIWSTLQAFGAGMASSKSPFWGQALGAGAQELMKTQEEQQQQARQLQLAALGISEKLDDKAQSYQEKLGEIAGTAVNQAEAHREQLDARTLQRQTQAFQDVGHVPGAQYGPMNTPPGPGWKPVLNPNDPANGWWIPPAMQVTKDILPILGANPTTGQPYKLGDTITFPEFQAANKQAQEIAAAKLKAKPTQAQTDAARGVSQTFAAHPELGEPPPNADGTPRDPTTWRLTDLPANLQPEAQWRTRILSKGWTKDNVEGIVADPNAPSDLQAIAKSIQAGEVAQAGAKAGEVATKSGQAKQALTTTGPLQLTANGQKVMQETDSVGRTMDQLIKVLQQPKYANDNNPLSIAVPYGKYKIGMATGEDDQLGSLISKLSLAAIQGAMPYASKTRNYQYIKKIFEHLPNVGFDSPQNMLQKLITARQGIMGIERSAMQWDVKGAGPNAAAPALTKERAQIYYNLAGGDPERARQMAADDGWAVGQ